LALIGDERRQDGRRRFVCKYHFDLYFLNVGEHKFYQDA
jgi:hypothetical protein